MTDYVESKTFQFRNPPTGLQIAELVRENNLQNYSVDIDRTYSNPTGMMTGNNSYVYDVKFSKRVATP